MFRKVIVTRSGPGVDCGATSVVSALTDEFGGCTFSSVKRSRRRMSETRSLSLSKTSLYGRLKERKVIIDMFSKSATASRMICLQGEQGCGKTALVESLRGTLVDTKGAHFVSARFHQMTGSTEGTQGSTQDPLFQCVVAALSDLCDLIAQQDDSKRLGTQIVNELGEHACRQLAFFISSLPRLTHLEADPAILEDSFSSDSFQPLTSACTMLIQELTSEHHPVVLFFDDIRLVGEESVRFLMQLGTSPGTRHLLLICCMAADDLESEQRRRQLVDGNDRAREILLPNLTLDSVNDWISEAMDMDTLDCMLLSHTIFRKTGGNPYFVQHFAELLEEKDMLHRVRDGWDWDLERIQGQTNVTENVVPHIVEKLRQQDSQLQVVMKLAAFLGFEFYRDMLATVVTEAFTRREACTTNYPKSLNQILIIGIKEGIIEEGKRDLTLKFTHQQVHEIAHEFIPEDMSTQETHVLIGRVLLKKLEQQSKKDFEESGKLDRLIFTAANHLNQGIPAISSPTEKLELARLNLRAGKRAKENNEFHLATNFLHHGIALLPVGVEKWRAESYFLALELYREAPALAFIVGQFDECNGLVKELSENARSPLDTIPAYVALVDTLAAQDKLKEATETALEALDFLGEKILTKSKNQVWSDMKKLQRQYRGKSVLELWDGPESVLSRKRRDVLELFKRVALFAPFAGMENVQSLSMLILMKKTIEEGASPMSPAAYATYASLQANAGNHEEFVRFANAADRMLTREQPDPKNEFDVLSMILTGTSHWTKSVLSCVPFLVSASEATERVGSVHMSFMSSYMYLAAAWHSGSALMELELDMRSFCESSAQFYVGYGLNAPILPLTQACANLTGSSNSTDVLDGDVMDRKSILSHLQKNHNIAGLMNVHLYELQVAFLFDSHDAALEVCQILGKHVQTFQWHFNIYAYLLYSGLTYLQAYSANRKMKYLRNARQNQKLLQKWMKHGNPNCEPYYLLLKAEEVVVVGTKVSEIVPLMSRAPEPGMKVNEIVSWMSRAIDAAERSNLIHVEALAHERAAVALLRARSVKQGRDHLQQAMRAYEAWQASAKVDQLKAKYRGTLRVVERTLTAAEIEELCDSSSHT